MTRHAYCPGLKTKWVKKEKIAPITVWYADLMRDAMSVQHSLVRVLVLNQKTLSRLRDRVKSGNFGHQVNTDIPLQTVEIQTDGSL